MKALFLGGAGFIGTQAVEDLVRSSDFSEITLGDNDPGKAQQLVSRLNDRRLSVRALEVTKENELVEAMKSFDIVISALPFSYDVIVTRACIRAHVNGIDVSSAREQMEMNEEAKKAGITYVMGCGATPGVTNVLARRGANLLDRTDEIQISWAAFRCMAPAPGLVHTTFWEFDPTIDDRVRYENGKYQKVPPFSGERTVEFAKPIGVQKVYYVPHPEPLTIPKAISVRRMSIRGTWPSETMRLLRFMNCFGLYRREPMEIKGQTIVPYEWLSEYLLKVPEAKETAVWGYGLIVEVSGVSKRKKVKHTFRTSHPPMQKWGGKDAYARNVGYPLSIGAQLLAEGEAKTQGIIAPEVAFDPGLFIRELAKREIKVSHRTERIK
jgi:saccharopine dehydrogenase-like NADP-dependent oxidoreductase